MSRVVTTPALDAHPHRLVAAPVDRHDPVVRDLVDRAAARAHERGREEGHREGVAAATTHARELADALTEALERATTAAASARTEQVEAVLELGVAIAEAVLGHEPHDGGQAVAVRVREALDQVVEPAATVHVHPGDHDLVARALADRGVEVVEDSTLAPGDARVRGGWAEVDLTRATAWQALRGVLDGR